MERCLGRARGVDTPLGTMPRFEDLNWMGLEKISEAKYAELANIDQGAWKEELALHDEFFGKLGERLPDALEARLSRMHQELGT